MLEIWKQLEKQHGDEGLFVGSDDGVAAVESIPTGSFVLDDALGIWGVPRGHIVQYAGFQSSGKTLLSLTTIAEWQKKDPRNWAMFIDAEFSYDQNWARMLGVDTDRLFVYKENDGTKIFERLVGLPKKDGEGKQKKGILDIEIEMGGTGLGIIVLDSVAAVQPPIEQNNAVNQQDMAPMARFLPKVLRRLTPLLSETGVTLIAINQIRMKPGVMYGNPEDSPGGTALKFACAQMVNFAKIGAKDSAILDSAGEQTGHHIRARIDKNKKAPPHRQAEFAIEYLKGIVAKNEEVKELGVRYGVIARPNNKTYELDGVKYNGKDAIADALLDPTLQESVMLRVKDAKANNVSVSQPVDEQEEGE